MRLMVWFRVDDSLPTHRKVLNIPRGARRLAAIGAWTLAGAWSSGNTTDGLIPAVVLEELAVPAKVAADLVACGLWLAVPEGYRMHDFTDYNPTAEKVTEERGKAAERQRKAREARQSRRDEGAAAAVTSSRVTRESRRDTPVTHAVTTPVSHVAPDPARPDPTRPDPKEQLPGVASAPPSGFEAWWSIYPRREAKRAAATAYAKALRVTDAETLISAAERYRDDPNRDLGFTRHASTWLNQGCWDDDPLPPRSTGKVLSSGQASHPAADYDAPFGWTPEMANG